MMNTTTNSTVLLRTATVEEAIAAVVRISPLSPDAVSHAHAVASDIDQSGETAARRWARQLGDIKSEHEPIIVSRKELCAARDELDTETRGLLERTTDRVTAFARLQREAVRDVFMQIDQTARAGHTFVPVQVAGCYAPGGRHPLVSSAIMTVATARAAGVEHVVLASPRPGMLMKAAAAIAGADSLLALGGAPAVIALARGICGAPRCDVIVGPGNKYVTAAKHLVSASTGIDMLAGPSELLIAADESADPVVVAADLLAQAEHDPDARPLLVTTDPSLPERVNLQLLRQLQTLPTANVAREACANGFACVVQNWEQLLHVIDVLAPEHLELQLSTAREVAERVRNAGAIFIGAGSAESLGDYGAGPNHVLPTGGTARFRAGLSVLTFLRARTWLEVDRASPVLVRDVTKLAQMEGLPAHERAVTVRTLS